jgi:hypothetical protein
MIRLQAICDFCKKTIGDDFQMVNGMVKDPRYTTVQTRQVDTLESFGICEDCHKKMLALIQPDPKKA